MIGSWLRQRRKKGQALIEFALIFMILMLVVSAAFEVARYSSLSLRVSSAVREVARLIVAEDIEPNPVNSVAQNNLEIRNRLNADIFPYIDDIIAPGNIIAHGKIWVSFLTRSPSPTQPNDPTKDRMIVTYQFSFPGAASTDSRGPWLSTFGTPGTVVPAKRVPIDGFSRGESTVAVEIYHRTNLIFPDSMLQSAKLDQIYDMAVF